MVYLHVGEIFNTKNQARNIAYSSQIKIGHVRTVLAVLTEAKLVRFYHTILIIPKLVRLKPDRLLRPCKNLSLVLKKLTLPVPGNYKSHRHKQSLNYIYNYKFTFICLQRYFLIFYNIFISC